MFRVPGRTIPQNANEHDLSSGHVSRSSAVRAQEAGAPTPELKGTIPQQAQFVPYLQGYIASLAADYQTALADFQKANQNDSSIQGMMAQSFEELGKENAALECYRKASMATALNPQAPYAAPFTKENSPPSQQEADAPQPRSRASWQVTQYRAHGSSSSLFGSMSPPHSAHTPYVPCLIRSNARFKFWICCWAAAALWVSVCLSYSAAA